MEIKNNVKELITLSIARTQTLQYWVKRIQEVIQSKKKSDFKIENVELLRFDPMTINDTFLFAIAHLDLNHPVFLGMDSEFVKNFVFESHKQEWDEFDYSIANSSLNDLVSNLRMNPKYQFKKLNNLTTDLSNEDKLELRFNYSMNEEKSYLSFLIYPANLESYLNRYHDPKSKNLDAMMDVPVTVSVELGSLSKKVKEIMEFTQGTLLELEQTVDSSCKVIVNNHVIAQGEVVEVNGNFGVMMTKIDGQVDFMK